MKIDDIYKLEEVVLAVLEESELARKDDAYLIACVIEKIRPYITNRSITYVLKHAKEFELPSFESITRCRRKLQQRNPELRDSKTAEARFEETVVYENYAIGG